MLKSVWVWIAGSVVTILAIIRSLFLQKIRLREQEAELIYDKVVESGKKWIIHSEYAQKNELPRSFMAYCSLNGFRFKLEVNERMLRAGWSGTDILVYVTTFRWNVKKLYTLIEKSLSEIEDKIPLYIMKQNSSIKIGDFLIPEKLNKPYINDDDYNSVVSSVEDVMSEKIDKAGILLYGNPGNGKSYLIRHLSLKFKLPIYIISFTKEMNNHDIIYMFSKAKGPCVILFEDFDNYFDKRECLMDEAAFTFDTILNVLDGSYCTHKKIIFCMTANKIEKIDSALKDRPSRFRVVKNISEPNFDTRLEILNDVGLAEQSDGYNLDQVLLLKEDSLKKNRSTQLLETFRN